MHLLILKCADIDRVGDGELIQSPPQLENSIFLNLHCKFTKNMHRNMPQIFFGPLSLR